MSYCGSCQMSPCSCNDDTLTLPTGSSGLPGPQGVQGAQGIQGIQGIAGTDGAAGPVTCRKLSIQFTGNPAVAVTVATATTFTLVGMLSNVYQIDSNNITTANAPAQNNDFVWQVWKADGTGGWTDAAVANLNSVQVTSTGQVRVHVTTTDIYKLVIIG